jgi:hypothetical protein
VLTDVLRQVQPPDSVVSGSPRGITLTEHADPETRMSGNVIHTEVVHPSVFQQVRIEQAATKQYCIPVCRLSLVIEYVEDVFGGFFEPTLIGAARFIRSV